VLISSLVVFLIYLIPEWRAFFLSDVFVFANAWDEEAYLSWQGTLGFKTVPGYFPLHLNWAMQAIGLSGAVQNLIFDTVLPPATAGLVFLTLRIWKVDPVRAAAYATLICFGSVLFNANNPLVASMLGDSRSNTIWIMSGWEVYASILRTPNPQIPFFLIACAIFGYARLGKWWILILPLPLLYYPTAVPYSFLLLLSFLYQQLRLRLFAHPALAISVASAATFVAMGVGLIGLSYLMGLYQADNYWRNISYLFSETRRPQLPVGLIALAVLFSLGTLAGFMHVERRLILPIAILSIASIGAVNLHIFTGFMLSQKNYYDYGLSVLLAILTVIAIDSLRHDFAKSAALMATLVVISLFSHWSQQIWFRNAIQLSGEMSPNIEKVRLDPLRAIFPKIELAANVAFSTPRLLSPLAGHYYTIEINTQCGALSKLVKNSVAFLNDRLPANSKQLAELLQSAKYMESVNQRFKKSRPDYSYCAGVDFENKDFYLVGPGLP
jgi:hypothetical protein